ncbi:energy transducer TonB [Parabacteroides johnsonii]|uniref:energy transducer TonB n=1 Tax=Parabacteroides johnsonii TaxID=387661 RepID=UPI00266D0A5F|nr:energy transducer TonB [Parabacteroides johnsonii]
MKTKVLVGILFYFLIGCVNKTQKSNVISESDSASNAISIVEDTTVDQSAGLQVIEALSKVYGDKPNVIGDFIGSPRCPSFLEGMFFDGSILVFQVKGDTLQARRTLEVAANSKAFRLEQVTESNYSQQQLKTILDELRLRYDRLTDKKLKSNMCSWGMGLRYITVRFILNTPEARQAFREKLMDSPAIRFEGPEQPIVNGRIGVTDTLGISLHPEYSVYSTDSFTASFVLLNQGNKKLLCGEHYFMTYKDENGIWRELPINDATIDIGYVVFPGGHKLFTARLYPDIHTNTPGRYRFFYEVMLDAGTTSSRHILMMTEFRLTDNKQEVINAIRMKIPEKPINYGAGYIPTEENPLEENAVYHVVDNMPEFPGGMKALLNFIDNNVQYPAEARKKGIQGRVHVQFIVDEDGYIIEPNIVRSVEPALDKEALRIIKILPQWKPGTLQGKAVKVKYTIPVAFKLNK